MTKAITEVSMPDGRRGIVERHDDGRLKSITVVDAGPGVTERYEPVDGGLKITATLGEASATAVITRKATTEPQPATEAARTAAAALAEVEGARQRQAVREAADKVAQVMDGGGSDRAGLVTDAYDLFFGGGAASWFADRASGLNGNQGDQP